MSKLLTLLLLLLSGCSGSQAWNVDSRFTTEERAEIQQAADLWTDAGQPIDLVWGQRVTGFETSGRHILRSTARGAGQIDDAFYRPKVEAMYFKREFVEHILTAMDRPFDPFTHVIAHELGHSLGLKHVDGDGAMMNSKTVFLGCLTAADMEELCRVTGCAVRQTGCDE